MESNPDFVPCPCCGYSILRNKQRCPYCGSTAIYQERRGLKMIDRTCEIKDEPCPFNAVGCQEVVSRLINTIQNTKRWTGGIDHLLIHPETLQKFKAEAKRIVSGYELNELKVITYEVLCGIPIKTSPDCQVDKIYFGIKY